MTRSMSSILTSREEPSILVVTLNRPAKRNALDTAMLESLVETVSRAHADPAVRVLLFQGAGPVFCAGMDLREAAGGHVGPAERVAQMLERIHNSPLVTIAAVQGAAIAGGAGLMAACDFVVAAQDVKIGFPEVQRGLVAALVAVLLRRQIRERDLRELLLLGDVIDAAHAQRIGLVNRIVAADAVGEEARRLARLVQRGAPGALAATKQCIAELASTALHRQLEQALGAHRAAREAHEAREGIAAFFEKRPPSWVPGEPPP